jgi:hypothetical protein
MRNSGSLRRSRAALSADCSREGRLQIKRTASRIQARIHAAESIEKAAEFAARPARNEGAVAAREDPIVPAKSPRSKLQIVRISVQPRRLARKPLAKDWPAGPGRQDLGQRDLVARRLCR